MAVFASPRFAGDDVLERILDDPDTGALKLGPGSPEQSVIALQQALFDLTWNQRIVPPVHEEADFVDGIYGPSTTAAVTAYKTQYDIHFPPSAPTGFIDGFAGPRTFRALDGHCVLLDEAIAAIREKEAALAADGTACELVNSEHATLPILGTSGTFSPAHVDGASGAILFKRGIGAFEVHGPIFDAYLAGPFAGGGFGFPVSDEHAVEDPFIRRSDFEHGFMTVSPDTGEVRQIGPDPHAPEPGLF
jgi:hypothetical protein